MRPTILVLALLALAAPPVLAQTAPPPVPAIPPATNGRSASGSVTTVAPTPTTIPEAVAPADRAGNNTSDPAGPVASTPFSAGPQGGGGGQISPALRNTEPSGSPSTPNLGR